MTNKKTTRRALVTSILSLLLCLSMLVGTTFAWFTDSVTSGVNKIVAGNLDVELYHTNAKVENESVAGNTALFRDENGDQILWEPGVVVYENLTVVNKGTLALKYTMSVNFENENAVKGDEEYKLSQILKVAVVPGGVDTTKSREEMVAGITNWQTMASFAQNGELYPEGTEGKASEAVFGIVIYWEPSAEDNNWNLNNGKTTTDGADHLHIDLGVVLNATQFTYEEDSFDDQYDKNAGWLGAADTTWYNDTDTEFTITTAEQLAGLAQLVNGGNTFAGKTVKLGADINLAGSNWTPIGTKANSFQGTFDGQGNTISNMTVNTSVYAGLFGYARTNTVAAPTTIKNLVIENADLTAVPNAEYDAYAGAALAYGTGKSGQGKINVTGVTVTNSTVTGKNAGSVVGTISALGNIESCKAENCAISGSRMGGIAATLSEASTLASCEVTGITKTVKLAGDESAIYTGVYVGRVTGGSNSIQDGNDAAVENVATSNAELDEAIAAGETTIYLKKGDYNIPDSAKGKTLTIIGSKETRIGVMDDGSYEHCDYSAEGGTITFEGLTIVTDSHTYAGYARMNGTYNNCVIEGTYTLYGTSEFNNCTFNISGDNYNIWTWGATTAKFTDCTFNTSGKAILHYGASAKTVIVNNCVFNDDNAYEDVNNKAAIEVGTDWTTDSKEIIATNCTVNGFDITNKGINTGSTLWGNKNSMPGDRLDVVVDNENVY